MNFNYISQQIPENYKCGKCGATGKLWRQYNTINPDLFCVDCALKDQNATYKVQEDGRHVDKYGITCDQIEWLVPAIPTEEGNSYWGYTSVPESGVLWWQRLPLRIKW